MVSKTRQAEDDNTFFFITFPPVFGQNFPFDFMTLLHATSYDIDALQHKIPSTSIRFCSHNYTISRGLGATVFVLPFKLYCMAEYCGTPRLKERSNSEYKVCPNERALLRLLDLSTRENGAILGASVHGSVRFWLADGSGPKSSGKSVFCWHTNK